MKMEWIFTTHHCLNTAMNFLTPVVSGCFVMLVTFGGLSLFAGKAAAQSVDFRNLQPTVEAVRSTHKLPALGAALVTSEGVQSLSTAGVRKRGDTTAVTNDDLWHIGSDGKAMTATIIARLVERGTLKWTQTLGETFPELAPQMKDDMKSVTMTQLLSHHAGFNANFDLMRYVNRKDLTAARIDVLKEAMAKGLLSAPGSMFSYSNWGYTVASAMAERASGKSFESLMRDEVFTPLEMKSAGFGGTGTLGKIDQPWPHTNNGKPTPSNGPEMDNPPVMAAAGGMHMSLADWAKFVREHLRGAQGKSTFLKQETFVKLHTPVGSDYALGWLTPQRGWAGGNTLHHGGDNTMNYALVWAAPAKDFAMLVVTNQSGAQAPADELVGAMLKAWLAREKK